MSFKGERKLAAVKQFRYSLKLDKALNYSISIALIFEKKKINPYSS